jgi:hypothetical protein
MTETVLWYILLLAFGVGVVFTYGIVDDLFCQWRQRQNLKKKFETGNHRTVPRPVQPTVSAKPVMRGYDSRLFWEDALLRIEVLKRQIDAELKKED